MTSFNIAYNTHRDLGYLLYAELFLSVRPKKRYAFPQFQTVFIDD